MAEPGAEHQTAIKPKLARREVQVGPLTYLVQQIINPPLSKLELEEAQKTLEPKKTTDVGIIEALAGTAERIDQVLKETSEKFDVQTMLDGQDRLLNLAAQELSESVVLSLAEPRLAELSAYLILSQTGGAELYQDGLEAVKRIYNLTPDTLSTRRQDWLARQQNITSERQILSCMLASELS